MARQAEKNLFSRFFILTLILLALIIIATGLVGVLWRQLEERTTRMRRALDSEVVVFGSSPNPILVTEATGEIRIANPISEVVFGIQPDGLIGKDIRDVLLFSDSASGDQNCNEFLSLQERHPSRVTALRMDGSSFCAEVTAASNIDINGKPIGVFIVRDISDILSAEASLRAARDEAERNAVSKTMFLANMSHEMRTPLHGLSAALDLIDADALSDADRDLVEIARSSSDRIIQEVNDVLEITRIGETPHQIQVFKPKQIVEDIARELTPLAIEQGTRIEIIAEGKLADLTYLGIARSFSRAIYNLTSNAVKFTNDGLIQVKLVFQQGDQNDVLLAVEVSDNGIGIAEEDKERIFSEFETIQYNHVYQGTSSGLGLPIARLAVASMGGQLQLHSTVGIGSTFDFSIVLELSDKVNQAEDPIQTVLAKSSKPLEVLVVDDKEVNLTLLSMMVRQIGHTPTNANNGLEALSFASHRRYDVILMDDSMPVMGGREAVRHIRAGGPSMNALILGVTAFTNEARFAAFADAGADDVLIKPVKKAQLAEAIQHFWKDGGLLPRATVDPERQSSGELFEAYKWLGEAVGRTNAHRLLEETLADVATQSKSLLDNNCSLEVIADRLHGVVGTTSFAGLDSLSKLLRSAEVTARAGKRQTLEMHHLEISRCLERELVKMATIPLESSIFVGSEPSKVRAHYSD